MKLPLSLRFISLLALLAILPHSIGLLGAAEAKPPANPYFDATSRPDVLAGGARKIEIKTPKGSFRVWTKRTGNNPRIKVLLLHGGPGATHEYFEACDSYFPPGGVEYYYYDQLGSAYSDQPDDESLWDTARFVDEVEQVRVALGLTKDNFYLLGHSWGGILAIEYALKHPNQLKGLIVSNMMSSIPAYNAYANKELKPAMDPKALAEITKLEAARDFTNPRYEELLMSHYYTEHLLRLPPDQWPEPLVRGFGKLNKKLYTLMQGPSELGALPGCKLEHWDRSADLARIEVPALVIGARYDTMEPAHLEWMARQLPRGRYLFCPQGSHMALYDDQQTWFTGVIEFLHQVDAGK